MTFKVLLLSAALVLTACAAGEHPYYPPGAGMPTLPLASGSSK